MWSIVRARLALTRAVTAPHTHTGATLSSLRVFAGSSTSLAARPTAVAAARHYAKPAAGLYRTFSLYTCIHAVPIPPVLHAVVCSHGVCVGLSLTWCTGHSRGARVWACHSRGACRRQGQPAEAAAGGAAPATGCAAGRAPQGAAGRAAHRLLAKGCLCDALRRRLDVWLRR